MMITNLPSDLLEEIFSRLPLKSVRGVRLTCRTWNTLSKGQIFAKMHIGKAFPPPNEGESRMILTMEDKLFLISIFDDLSINNKGKLTCLDEQVKISHVFHCEGLLLCILKDDDTRVVVWNPYLGQTRWVETRYSQVLCEPKPNMFSYALGYENKRCCRNHKLLRFVDFLLFKRWDEFSPKKNRRDEFVWYEIYDFESGLWTTLDVSPYWRITTYNHGVSLKGNTYWCARKRNSSDTQHIICFDYTRERFGPLLPLHDWMDNVITLTCVREEKLAALCDFHGSYAIWITTRVEAGKVSWGELLTFDLDPPNDCLKFGSFYIDEVKKVAMLFGKRWNYHTVCIIKEEGGDFELVDLRKRRDKKCSLQRVCSYVPSLVQVKQPQRRKKQCDLENFRYDEMLSRLSFFNWRWKMRNQN